MTGLAQYGADLAMPGMLVGRILRSPHAHARIRSIDTSKAAALPGVKAVVTSADFPEQKFEYVGPERVAQNFWHMTRNIMAREKVLYEGHAVAAVAATSKAIADEALSLIAVDYEVLPHVIDVDEAMQPDAPLLFPDMITRGVEPPPTRPPISRSGSSSRSAILTAGFAAADEIVEMSFKTAPVHQAYIEPQGCVARFGADGQGETLEFEPGPLRRPRLHREIARHEARRFALSIRRRSAAPSAARPSSMSSRWPSCSRANPAIR